MALSRCCLRASSLAALCAASFTRSFAPTDPPSSVPSGLALTLISLISCAHPLHSFPFLSASALALSICTSLSVSFPTFSASAVSLNRSCLALSASLPTFSASARSLSVSTRMRSVSAPDASCCAAANASMCATSASFPAVSAVTRRCRSAHESSSGNCSARWPDDVWWLSASTPRRSTIAKSDASVMVVVRILAFLVRRLWVRGGSCELGCELMLEA
ncbi:hypothetical protein DFP73DRAFT_567252 [Morchella snyderi]|nr:hypothetical protein DFP73DRAFT_567252 [Morchella snyderi]